MANRLENGVSSAGCDAVLDPSGEKGSIARIALLVGGKRVNESGQEDPNGEYIIDAPLEDKAITYCSVGPGPNGDWHVLDTRPTDNRIRTSPGAGLGKVLAWTNDGDADTHGGVSTAEDELIINSTRVTATGTRALAVDNDNNLWVGGDAWTGPDKQDHGNHEHQKVDGETGLCLPGTQFNLECGGYGALMDHSGVLWSADWYDDPPWDKYVGALLRYDPADSAGARVLDCVQLRYGLGIDPTTGHIWATGNTSTELYEINAETGEVLNSYPQGLDAQSAWTAQGVAVDCQGHVWIAEANGSRVLHLAPDPQNPGRHYPVGYVRALESALNEHPFRRCTGLAVDVNRSVWVTERGVGFEVGRVSRVDPLSGPILENGPDPVGRVSLQIDLPDGSDPYNYSDMTGFVGRQAGIGGAWTVKHDGGVGWARWNLVEWNKADLENPPAECPQPDGTRLVVRARAAETEAALEDERYIEVQNGVPFEGLRGRWVQVRVFFGAGLTCDLSRQSPVLCNLRVGVTELPDCNDNSLPDVCELDGNDCNDNGVLDSCELASGGDCNSNTFLDACEIPAIYAGTQPGRAGGQRKVFRHKVAEEWEDLTPYGLGQYACQSGAIMDVAFFQGHLYAGLQTSCGMAGKSGHGEVWRYDGGKHWTRVGTMDNSVMVLEVMTDPGPPEHQYLYAGTSISDPLAGRVYRCEICDGSDWTPLGGGGSGFRAGIVSTICNGQEGLYLGELYTDAFWYMTPQMSAPVLLEDHDGSCIWDFAEYSGKLFAGAWAGDGPVFRMTPESCLGSPWFSSFHDTDEQNWALEAYTNRAGESLLFVGTAEEFPSQDTGGKLRTYDGTVWGEIEHYWPSMIASEGVSALAAIGDYWLFIGTGIPDGYDYTNPGNDRDGRAEVWRTRDGITFALASPDDSLGLSPFGGAVQCLHVRPNTQEDCDLNGVPDPCQDDTDEDGVIDACDNCPAVPNLDQRDTDGDGFGDACDICPETPNPNQDPTDCDGNGIPDECEIIEDPTLDCQPNGVLDICEGWRWWCGHCIGPVNLENWPDADADGDVDDDDFGSWQLCFTGSGQNVTVLGLAEACRIYDRDCDNDVDVCDLLAFDECRSGPAMTAIACSQDPISPAANDCQTPEPQPSPPPDEDEDGIPDDQDNCPLIANANQADQDEDGVGDLCDGCAQWNPIQWDGDGDQVPEPCDNCYWIANAGQEDSDSDGWGNACDNCPDDPNPDQWDSDFDHIGDVCDTDDDGDGLADASDNCPLWPNGPTYGWCMAGALLEPCTANYHCDSYPGAGDGVCDLNQADSDSDGVGDGCDNCPAAANADQADFDGDWIGDACDNCPYAWNYDQLDTDLDGIGDECDGESLMGGESMMMSLDGESGLQAPSASEGFTAAVSASLVVHGCDESQAGSLCHTVTLPAQGGTVVVDLVLNNALLINDFYVRLGMAQPNVVELQQITAITVEPTDSALGWMNRRFQTFYSTDMFGGTCAGGLWPGQYVAATITLNVAPQLGTYEVRMVDAIYTQDEFGLLPVARGPALNITVGP